MPDAAAPAKPRRPRAKRDNLTAKQERFVDAVTGEAEGKNATAARIAGYSFPKIESVKAARSVAPHVKARVKRLAMGSAECLGRLAAQARVDISDYADLVGQVDPQQIRSTLLRLQQQGKAGGIKRLTPTRFGLSIELVDSQAALTTIAKHLGLLRDRLDVNIQTPAYDASKIRALLNDPEGLDLVCALDSRLAALAGPQSDPGQVIDVTPAPSAEVSESTVGGSAPKVSAEDLGADNE